MEPDPIKNKKSTEYQELLAFFGFYSKLYIGILSNIGQGVKKRDGNIHKAITIFERRQYENEKQKDKIYRNYSNGSNGSSNAYAGGGTGSIAEIHGDSGV